ncbi:serine protease [Cystoisospora suis]|uniref:Serine protease n=1 Tax=Cystoisospora suis TaxID=483139 RepID=A0A2C6KAD5_9APIC|nr:serine protease [Cystoisospora suis]
MAATLPTRHRGSPHQCLQAFSNDRNVWYSLFFLFTFTFVIVAGAGSGAGGDGVPGCDGGRRGRHGDSRSSHPSAADAGEQVRAIRRPGSSSNVSPPLSDLAAYFYAATLDVEPDKALKNYIMSPFSILRMFHALEDGAGGETLDQMRALMDEDTPFLDPPPIEGPGVFRPAERLYVRRDFEEDTQLRAYREHERTRGVEVISAEFESAQQAVDEVNTFVADTTENHITELLNLDDVPASPDILLLNVAVFQAPWEQSFDRVQRGFFRSLDRGEQHVEFMEMVTGATHAQFFGDSEVQGYTASAFREKLSDVCRCP